MKQIEIKKNNKYNIICRVFQAICCGIFALGISMIAGDYTTFIKSPISTLSITTTIFGFFGIIITEIMARQSKKW